MMGKNTCSIFKIYFSSYSRLINRSVFILMQILQLNEYDKNNHIDIKNPKPHVHCITRIYIKSFNIIFS